MSTIQILSDRNSYQAQLIRLAEEGERFVVACTQDGCEPNYEGFDNLAAATARANELEKLVCGEGEDSFTCSHSVYELIQDEDGDWTTNYEDAR